MLRPNPDPPAALVPAAPALAPHVTVLWEAIGAVKESDGEGSEEQGRPVGKQAPEVVPRWPRLLKRPLPLGGAGAGLQVWWAGPGEEARYA